MSSQQDTHITYGEGFYIIFNQIFLLTWDLQDSFLLIYGTKKFCLDCFIISYIVLGFFFYEKYLWENNNNFMLLFFLFLIYFLNLKKQNFYDISFVGPFVSCFLYWRAGNCAFLMYFLIGSFSFSLTLYFILKTPFLFVSKTPKLTKIS